MKLSCYSFVHIFFIHLFKTMQQNITLPTNLTLEQVLTTNEVISFKLEASWQQGVEIQGQDTSVETYKYDQQQVIKSFLRGIICSTLKQNANYYSQQFIRSFLLIKINSLTRPQCAISPFFLKSLISFYNQKKALKIGQSALESDIIAQILLQINCTNYLSLDILKNILEGDCLVVTTCCYAIHDSWSYLKKMEYIFSLSFVNMKGRKKAFIPIVHKEKNHKGQAYYAQRINNLVELKSGEVQMKGKVQDPYSMRCSPHVHGVAYDILQELQEFINCSINKFHFETLLVQGQFYPNLQLHSESLTLKFDFLMLALIQIGSMSFLRSQRMLNSYLANKVSKQHPNYYELHKILQRVSQMVGDNKLLSIGTNNDSTTYNNYQKDIYYSQGKLYKKCRNILHNLYHIMFLQTKINVLTFDDKMKEDLCIELKNQLEKLQKLKIKQDCGVDNFRYKWIVSK